MGGLEECCCAKAVSKSVPRRREYLVIDTGLPEQTTAVSILNQALRHATFAFTPAYSAKCPNSGRLCAWRQATQAGFPASRPRTRENQRLEIVS